MCRNQVFAQLRYDLGHKRDFIIFQFLIYMYMYCIIFLNASKIHFISYHFENDVSDKPSEAKSGKKFEIILCICSCMCIFEILNFKKRDVFLLAR
jgi:hypothetical protein